MTDNEPKKAKTVNTVIRLSPELYERLTALTRRTKRSLNSEMLYLLERAIEEAEHREGLSDARD